MGLDLRPEECRVVGLSIQARGEPRRRSVEELGAQEIRAARGQRRAVAGEVDVAGERAGNHDPLDHDALARRNRVQQLHLRLRGVDGGARRGIRLERLARERSSLAAVDDLHHARLAARAARARAVHDRDRLRDAGALGDVEATELARSERARQRIRERVVGHGRAGHVGERDVDLSGAVDDLEVTASDVERLHVVGRECDGQKAHWVSPCASDER